MKQELSAMKMCILICLSLILAGCSKPQVKDTQKEASSPPPALPVEKTADTVPPSATDTPESIVRKIFPNARETVRSIDCFRSFPRGVSMNAVVDKCGRPDGEYGSGIGYFIYHLNDGSTVNIRWTDINHIQEMEHVNKSRKRTSLLREP
jgi:hypothetical protein